MITKATTMAAFSPKSTKHYNVRSISLPARSHPTTLKLEQELNKLESWETSSPTIPSSPTRTKAAQMLSALSSLGDLYKCIGDLLALPLTQEVLAQHCHENWVNQLLDGMLRYLDICGNTRDSILSMKESVRELESAFRRSKCGELSIEGNVTSYFSSRKKMKNEIMKNLVSLKQIENVFECSPLDSDQNNHLLSVIGVLRRSSLITTTMLHFLLSFLSSAPMSYNTKHTKWSLISQLFHKKLAAASASTATFESAISQFEENEFESADVALSEVLLHHQQSSKLELLEEAADPHYDEKIEYANVKLEALDGSIGGFEDVLESLFRRLIHARVSLLNIISH